MRTDAQATKRGEQRGGLLSSPSNRLLRAPGMQQARKLYWMRYGAAGSCVVVGGGGVVVVVVVVIALQCANASLHGHILLATLFVFHLVAPFSQGAALLDEALRIPVEAIHSIVAAVDNLGLQEEEDENRAEGA